MKAKCYSFLLLAVLIPESALAQRNRRSVDSAAIPPKLLRINLQNPYLQVEYENERQTFELDLETDRRLDAQELWTPSIGGTLAGSLYHPNLADYRVTAEAGISDGERTIDDGPGDTRKVDDQDFKLVRFNGSITLLKEKPYATTWFYQRDRDQREYDRFRSFTVETERYGMRASIATPYLPISLRYTHFNDDTLDPERPDTRTEDTLHIQIVQDRGARDQSRLQHTTQIFDQVDDGFIEYSGAAHTVQITDRQYHGIDDRFQLYTQARYHDLDTDLSRNIDITAREHLRIQHQDNLFSELQYTYENRRADADRVSRHSLDLSLEHQLFESLRSTAGFEGVYDDAHGGRDRFDGIRYGPYIREFYTKQIGSSSRLQLRSEAQWHEEDRSSVSNDLTARNETLTLQFARPSLLRAPQVRVDSIELRDEQGSTLYFEGLDYRIVPRGEFVEVQRIAGGRIAEGSQVRVDYAAQDEIDENVATMDTFNSFRLELFDRLITFEARLRRSDSSGGQSLTFQDFSERFYAARWEWKWFNAGVAFEDYRADFLRYDDLRFSEGIIIGEQSWCTLRLQFDQSQARYPELNDQRDIDSGHLSLSARFTPTLTLQLTGSIYDEDGRLSDRELSATRTDLRYRVGKLDTSITYHYEEETTQNTERRRRHYFYVKSTRTF